MMRRVAAGVGLVAVAFMASGCDPAPYEWSFELISGNAAGSDSGNGGSGRSSRTGQDGPSFVVSADGSTIAFLSYASDLGPDDGGPSWDSDIYVYDVDTGTITLATVAAPGKPESQGDGTVPEMALSADGTKLAFTSTASSLVPMDDTVGGADVFVRDLVAGTTEMVSRNESGTDSSGGRDFAFSPDGTKVAFTSRAGDLGPPDNNNRNDVYLRDLVTGEITLLSTGPDGRESSQHSRDPAFSPEGDSVAFSSIDSLGLESPDDIRSDIFIHDVDSGELSLVSTEAPAPEPARTWAFSAREPVFSPDGSAIAYEAEVIYVVDGLQQRFTELELADLRTGDIELVSAHPMPTPTDPNADKTRDAMFSPDGTQILFQSGYGHFGPNDTNRSNDIYLRDLVDDTTSLITVNAEGTDAAGGSDPSFNSDGHKVTFNSESNELESADPDGHGYHVYLRELELERTTVVGHVAGAPFYHGNPTFISGGDARIAFVSRHDAFGPTDTNGDTDIYIAVGTRPSESS